MERRIAGFDGIRGIAALSIVAVHLDGLTLMISAGLGAIVPLVSTGVPWFYVLSGFLITNLLLRELRATGGISLKAFYMRRILRLFPVLFVCLLLVLLFAALGIRRVSLPSWVLAATYLYNYIPLRMYDTWLGSFHTLATEEHFYLVFPPLLLLMRRRLGALMCLLLSYAIVARIALLWVIGRDPAWGQAWLVWRWSIFAGEFIAAGCLAALALDRFPDLFRRWRAPLLVLGVVLYLMQMLNSTSWLTNVAITALILSLVLHPRSRMVRILETPVLRYLGQVSYGVYVWQSFFITTGPATIDHWPLPVPMNALLLTLAVPLSWQFVERPFLKLKDRFRPDGVACSA